jgi:hypothetical protein
MTVLSGGLTATAFTCTTVGSGIGAGTGGTIVPAQYVTSCSVSANSVSALITTTTAHGLTFDSTAGALQQTITVTGCGPFNGTYPVATGTTSTSIYVTLPAVLAVGSTTTYTPATISTYATAGTVQCISNGYNGVYKVTGSPSSTAVAFTNTQPLNNGAFAGGTITFQKNGITYTGVCNDLEIPWTTNA